MLEVKVKDLLTSSEKLDLMLLRTNLGMESWLKKTELETTVIDEKIGF